MMICQSDQAHLQCGSGSIFSPAVLNHVLTLLLRLWAGRLCHQLLRWNAASLSFTIFHSSASCQLWQRGLQAWLAWPLTMCIVSVNPIVCYWITRLSQQTCFFFFPSSLQDLHTAWYGAWCCHRRSAHKHQKNWAVQHSYRRYCVILCSAENCIDKIEHQSFRIWQQLCDTCSRLRATGSYTHGEARLSAGRPPALHWHHVNLQDVSWFLSKHCPDSSAFHRT